MSDVEYDEDEWLAAAMRATDFLGPCGIALNPSSVPAHTTLSPSTPILPPGNTGHSGENFHVSQEADSIKLLFSVKQQITDMFLENMKDSYLASGWPCDVMEKQKELFHKASRFILVTRQLGESRDVTNIHKEEIVAYMMFRFTWDDEDEPEYPVLYLYELQVRPAYQGQGWGKMLVDWSASIARHFRMRKVVLTCLKNTPRSMNFYLKNGFKIDANSPSRGGFMDEAYEILSRKP